MSFSPEQRARLLVAPKVGPVVLERLEALGLDSYDKIQRVGVDRAVRMVCDQTGNIGWACRRKALHHAFDTLGQLVAASADQPAQGTGCPPATARTSRVSGDLIPHISRCDFTGRGPAPSMASTGAQTP